MGSKDGLTYYMPKKDFLVKVSIKDNKIEKVDLSTSTAYADVSKQYLLHHGNNFFGKNTLDVGIAVSGLLSSAKSTTQSNVTEAFKGLATTIGQRKIFGLDAMTDTDVCTINGDHIFLFEKSGLYIACGISVEIKQHATNIVNTNHSKIESKEYSGIFYRQNIPYLVTANGGGVNAASILFSPSESHTYFLPISRTFFSNNLAEFDFIDGTPTKYKQETEGEAVALLKLPADVISAYFTSVGTVFDSFKTRDSKEAAALAESLKLALSKKQYEACIAAIESNDEAKIKELLCQPQ